MFKDLLRGKLNKMNTQKNVQNDLASKMSSTNTLVFWYFKEAIWKCLKGKRARLSLPYISLKTPSFKEEKLIFSLDINTNQM